MMQRKTKICTATSPVAQRVCERMIRCKYLHAMSEAVGSWMQRIVFKLLMTFGEIDLRFDGLGYFLHVVSGQFTNLTLEA